MLSTTFTVLASHPALPGHFPGNPLVPGAVILDHVIGAAVEQGFGPVQEVRSVKFSAPLLPGERCEVMFVQGQRGIKATCQRGDVTILTCLFVPGRP